MRYTPVELRHVRVGRSLFGYKRHDDRQAARGRRRQLRGGLERARRAGRQGRGAREAARRRQGARGAARGDARLRRARRSRCERAGARSEAELIIAEAHQEARSVTRGAQGERERLFGEVRRVETLLRAALGMVEETEARAAGLGGRRRRARTGRSARTRGSSRRDPAGRTRPQPHERRAGAADARKRSDAPKLPPVQSVAGGRGRRRSEPGPRLHLGVGDQRSSYAPGVSSRLQLRVSPGAARPGSSVATARPGRCASPRRPRTARRTPPWCGCSRTRSRCARGTSRSFPGTRRGTRPSRWQASIPTRSSGASCRRAARGKDSHVTSIETDEFKRLLEDERARLHDAVAFLARRRTPAASRTSSARSAAAATTTTSPTWRPPPTTASSTRGSRRARSSTLDEIDAALARHRRRDATASASSAASRSARSACAPSRGRGSASTTSGVTAGDGVGEHASRSRAVRRPTYASARRRTGLRRVSVAERSLGRRRCGSGPGLRGGRGRRGGRRPGDEARRHEHAARSTSRCTWSGRSRSTTCRTRASRSGSSRARRRSSRS